MGSRYQSSHPGKKTTKGARNCCTDKGKSGQQGEDFGEDGGVKRGRRRGRGAVEGWGGNRMSCVVCCRSMFSWLRRMGNCLRSPTADDIRSDPRPSFCCLQGLLREGSGSSRDVAVEQEV